MFLLFLLYCLVRGHIICWKIGIGPKADKFVVNADPLSLPAIRSPRWNMS